MNIKNILRIGLLFLAQLFILGATGNQVSANSEYEYTNLNVKGDIKIDGTIDVIEDFTADFFVYKHGIIRNIPLNYSVDGHPFHIEISNINVKGKNFTMSQSNGIIDIKIGDADRTVIGTQNYPITYKTYGLIRNFSGMGYSELYRNVVGNQFDTSFDKVKVELILPKVYTGFTSGDFLIAADGVSNRLEDFEGTIDWSEGDKIILMYDKVIPAGNGITLSVKFPNNYFEFNHKKQANLAGSVSSSSISSVWNTISRLFQKIKYLLAAAVVGIFGYGCFSIKRNKKKKIGEYPIVVQYKKPQGISPSQMAFLYHKGFHSSLVTSVIYKRASEGRISISYNKGWLLIKDSVTLTQKWDCDSAEMPIWESDYWDALPRNTEEGVKTAELPDVSFSKGILLANKEVQSSCEDKGRVLHKNAKTLLVIVVLTMFFSVVAPLLAILFFIAIFVMVFYYTRVELTDSGKKMLADVYGYKYFLEACEENQIRTFLKEDPNFVNETLPYAAALGLETKLIEMVKPIYEEMGESIIWFDGDISCISSAMRSIKESSCSYNSNSGSSSGYDSGSGFDSGSSFSSSSSSGSSGGGGGGGGGSSW